MSAVRNDYVYLVASRQRRRAMPQLTAAGRFWSLYFFGATMVVVGLSAYGYIKAVWRVVVGG